MNKFSIAPMIFAALTGSAFAETYHTLDYSMLNNYMNYNPKYDYYPGLMAQQSQSNNQNNSASSVSTASTNNAKTSQIAELQAKLEQLKQQRNENTKNLMTGSLSDMMTRSVQGRQLNTEIQNLEDRLTTLMTGQAPVRVVNQAAPRRSINCYTYGLGNAFTTCN